jgi:hypothetical protein
MQRNTETLSTRDLASPNEPGGGVTPSEGDVRDAKAPKDQHEARDQAAPVAKGTRLPVDEDAQLPANEQTAPPDDIRTAASATDQSVDVDRSDAGLGTKSGTPDYAAEDRPAGSAPAASTRDRDTEAAPQPTGATASASNGGSLLSADVDATFQQRWQEIQTRFVDEPRGAVEDADGLVANLMQQLAEGFAKERERLEAQWGRGEDISTEDLRVALQRYRTFFQRLLST